MTKTDYTGIDYSNGTSNRDKETGIHYGVIHHGEVGQSWYDESEADDGKPICPHCFNDLDETTEYAIGADPVTDNEGNEIDGVYFCSVCDRGIDDTEDIWRDEPLGFYYNQEGYQAEQSGDDPDIFITASPYYTTCQYCSPCAPGAGYLMNTVEGGIKAYCFGHGWFESGKAPYPVYDVKTDELIEPE